MMASKKWVYRIMVILFFCLVYFTENRYQFLILNVGLAYIPLEISWLYAKSKQKILSIALFVGWLLFYPNAFYMLTDFFHLSAVGMTISSPDVYFHFSLLTAGIMLGVFMGFESLTAITTKLKQTIIGNKIVLLCGFYVVLSILSAYAIYLGRFLRIHTVYLITDFTGTMNTVLDTIDLEMVHFVGVFTLLHLVILFLYQMAKKNV
ncbi:DUF1361 domain-containing protein [Carnobacterium divergens]|uniref:DUF1361 domain-containing protein n=2 Tax=Carnobacteriaceae TaxID=186828 RepID=UPI0010726B09|nr:DUF1361 domain-containing protein [Carnobacterium divergens]MDT1939578.1 DUF1361 domain-containing protein [Carnobacterium divergens]TFI74665.1 hypothetical protein CKN81_03695 [Carnobacterium divergens]